MLKSWNIRACALLLALVAPTVASAAEVVLRWAPVAGAISYDVQVARDRTFTDLLVDESVPTAGYRWSGFPEQDLFWRVRSIDAESRPSEWSSVRVIEARLETPRPETPKDDATIWYRRDPLEVDLAFSPSPRAVEYVVQMASTPAFDSVEAELTSPENRVRVLLKQTGRIHWRVRARGSAGRESSFSKPRVLNVVVPAPRDLVAESPLVWDPAAPTVNVRWRQPLALVKMWRVELAAGKEVVHRQTSREPHAAVELPSPGTYAVRVAALDSSGRPGVWSRWSHVAVSPPPDAPGAPEKSDEAEKTQVEGTEAGSNKPPVRAMVSPESIHLVADGTATAEVAVAFYDDDGRVVRDLPLRVACSDGAVEVVGADQGRFRVRYRAPSAVPAEGATNITLSVGTFEARARVELSQPPLRRWQVGAQVGWLTNAGAISSPYVALNAAWRTPWLDDRLALSAHAGYYGLRTTVANADVRVSGHFVPIGAIATYDLIVAPIRAYAGVGAGLVITAIGPSYDVSVAVFPMGVATAGVAYPLGPGEICISLAGELSLADNETVTGRVSAFHTALGYTYALPW